MKTLPVLIISALFALSTTSFFGCLQTTTAAKDPWRSTIVEAQKSTVRIHLYHTSPTTGMGQRIGGGTGVLISDNGLIVTAAHVLNVMKKLNKPYIMVELTSGELFPVDFQRSHPIYDIGIVKIKADTTKRHTRFCPSQTLVGTPVLVFGSPGEFPFWFSDGIVSKYQKIDDMSPFAEWMIFTADINPGVSGGPIFTMENCIAGSVSAYANGMNGIGIAVPSKLTEKAVRQLLTLDFSK